MRVPAQPLDGTSNSYGVTTSEKWDWERGTWKEGTTYGEAVAWLTDALGAMSEAFASVPAPLDPLKVRAREEGDRALRRSDPPFPHWSYWARPLRPVNYPRRSSSEGRGVRNYRRRP